jgi:heat shock protein HtpX
VKSFMKTTLLLGILTGLFLGVGYMVGGTSGAFIALLVAVVMNFGMFWFSHKLVLKMQRAKPLDEKRYSSIVRMVEELARQDNLPMPKLYFVDTDIPNAFATGRSHKTSAVAVTRGIVELLSENELRSVLAHELGHIKNRDMLVSTIAATIGGAIAFMAEMAFWGGALFGGGNDEEGNNWIGSLAMLLLAPFAAMIIQMAVSRSREYLADAHGAKLIGHGDDLASALIKLESFKPRMAHFRPSVRQDASSHLMFMNMFSARGLAGLFSTHPRTESRVKRLKAK